MVDYCIIGGGVIGCALARELSRYKTSVVLVEAGSDVCAKTSGANSGIVHAGYDAPEGTLKSYYNVLGAKMFRAYAKVLEVPYKKTGSLVISVSPEDDAGIRELEARGRKLGVNVSIINRDRILELEPNITKNVRQALYAPDAAIIDPFELVFALKENAEANGVEFLFSFEVKKVEKEDGYVRVISDNGSVNARTVINCAGSSGGQIARMFGDPVYLKFRAGEYILFDKIPFVNRPVFRVPNEKGKGALVCPTTAGNFFVGPTSVDIDAVTPSVRREAFEELKSAAELTAVNVPWDKMITSFCGVRSVSKSQDFIVQRSAHSKYLYNIIGICSPGLSAAPAIAVKVSSSFGLELKSDFVPGRRGIKRISNASRQERSALIAGDKKFGNIVCRCETVSEAEVIEAIKRGARTVDGVKKRLRTGMGRCQGGFCLPNIVNILARELGVSAEDVTKNGAGSEILMGDDA